MKLIDLKFYGPYPLVSTEKDVLSDCEYSNSKGIYLWTVKLQNGVDRIAYVGQTYRSFKLRTKEHILNQLSGIYAIYDVEQLMNGKLQKVWGGLWGEGRRDKLPKFITEYADLATKNLDYLKLMRLFLGPIDDEKNVMKIIEGTIVKEIKKDKEFSSLIEEGVRYYYPHDKKLDIFIKIECDTKIEGLPAEITI